MNVYFCKILKLNSDKKLAPSVVQLRNGRRIASKEVHGRRDL